MMPAPITPAEMAEKSKELLAAGGLFAASPQTINGVDYPCVFDLSQNLSLRDLMAMKGMEFAQKEFVVSGETRLTFAQIWASAMRFANWLTAQGIGPGDRVGIAMRNNPEWVIAFIGIISSGATVVPLNSWWQSEELADGVTRANIKLVVCDEKRALALAPLQRDRDLVLVGVGEGACDTNHGFADILADDSLSAEVPDVRIDPQSDFCLLYTSGSTGKSKGVLLSHQSAINAVLSWAFLLAAAQSLRPDFPFSPENPSVLLALPLFHVTALHSTLILSWMMGRKNVFMYKWDPEAAVRLINDESITNFVGVPTMAHDLISNTDKNDLRPLKDITTGGAKRAEAQIVAQNERFPDVAVSSGYGLTETNSLIAHITMRDFLDHPDSTGRAIPPINEMAVFSEEGIRLGTDEVGEICVKSPVTFRGYDGDPEATREAFFDGGWFRTGDIGRIDADGFIYIVDRAKDLIIRGGENVSCLEVENALLGFSGVDEAAVFAVPDERLGEIVGAVVYSRKGEIDLPALRAHVAAHLAEFKAPERLWLSPQPLPRGGTGKVDKRQTRTIALQYPPHLSV